MEDITRYGDLGTKELLERGEVIIDIVEGQPRGYRRQISPLHDMYAREVITGTQFSAGKKIFQYWTLGFVGLNSCEIQERVDGSSKGMEVSEAQCHARHQYYRGIAAAGAEYMLIKQVCCFESAPTNASMKRSERYSIMKRLRQTLDDIAKQYHCR